MEYFVKDNYGRSEPTSKFYKHLAFGVLALITLMASIRTINTGEVGVVTRFGDVTGRVLNSGIHTVIPFADSVRVYNTKKVIYETSTGESQKNSKANYKDYPVDTNTKDGQQVDIFYTVRFSVDPTKATWIAESIGNENALVDKIVKTESRVWIRNIPREYTATELYTGNIANVQAQLEEKLRPTFEANGLILDAVGIREIKFTEQYIGAIEAKQIEAVNIETAQNRAERAVFEKEAKITEAEGQAESQRLLRQDLNEVLVSKLWIEKWNGELPKVMSEGNIMDITKVLE